MAFYAVKVGREIGIYKTWDECLEKVKGYSGAEYKKFKTEAEAKEYLGMSDLFKLEKGPTYTPEKYTEVDLDIPKQPFGVYANTDDIKKSIETVMFYVDGSYNTATGVVGYGVVAIIDDGHFIKTLIRDFGSSTPVEDTSSRNVLGEIKGAIKATELAIANGYREITICYDYEGVEKWATNQWKAKNPLTQHYKAIMSERMKHVKVRFNKIKSHSGDQWNDEADRLAKLGAGI